MISQSIVVPLVIITALAGGGCTPEATPTTQQTSATATASPSAPPAPPPTASAAAAPHAFHYDLVLTGPEGSGNKVTMDVSEAAPATVSLGRNIMIGAGNRSDVGSKIKGQVTMKGDTPVLDLDLTLSWFNAAASKVEKVAMKGAAPTPAGASTVVAETTQDGKQYRLTATPTVAPPFGAVAVSGAHTVDVTILQSGSGAAAAKKTTQLTLTLNGDTPGVAKQGENVPLQVADGGVAVPRQDVGTRVKAVGRPHSNGMQLDFDLEMSAMEAPTTAGAVAVAIRKITSHGLVFATFDKPTTAFTAEENGYRYEVTVTPHRPK